MSKYTCSAHIWSVDLRDNQNRFTFSTRIPAHVHRTLVPAPKTIFQLSDNQLFKYGYYIFRYFAVLFLCSIANANSAGNLSNLQAEDTRQLQG